ncbi:M20/M25/M40 family metallo-hydrolase [Sphingomonas psychrotolerans]|uniref:M20/M25/M40 family metallo-hydrolase n=1 Tax=Sphingomonas psychrotolerans TaxID=1327635 RepID=A0ABU3N5M0_9SPHN|nr:M20/M25/M40 family metallo-hydrolase [Sphingomonas psychrotolerans]MDT8759551.1 M20/M25/M40 family metallo-hydrolase [Sphingomonas psychrotolerans]
MRHLATFFAVALAAGSAQAQTASPAEAQALELLKRGISFRTVSGEGNQTFDYANYLKSQLVAGGFADADVRVEKLGDTAYLVARYRGTGKAKNGAKPILISGHMDVVEAKPADWERDPFTPVVENGYLFGRGSSDNKFDVSTFTAAMIQLKREGFKPGRDILLLYSGDEETGMKTTAALAEQYHDAELLLNIDGGGGDMDETGKPVMFGVQGAEKSYADFELSVTNPGGHSSAPRKANAIYQLAAALQKIQAYEFPGQVNEITKASWAATAARTPDARLADAMRRFAANPEDLEARAALRADPGYVGQTGTTCVATMANAGHAPNALPQRATANINCRIFPGTPIADVQAKLAEVIGDPAVKVTKIESGSVPSDASPLRPELMKVITKAVHARFPDVPVVPVMSAGATDSMWFRGKGVASYGVSPLFMKSSDSFAHGLNERIPVGEIAPAVTFYKRVIQDLAK